MTIVITLPYFFDGEAEQITQFLRSSIDLIHLRKPHSTAEEMERLIRQIPSEYYDRLVLHDHHQLALKYHLHGVHLNSRNPQPPTGWTGSISHSCHSLEEVKLWKDKCNYVSLSPIFDSISKKGYHAAFSVDVLAQAKEDGIIDAKVLALGGVTFDRMDEVLRMGFGGGMILGDAWKNIERTDSKTERETNPQIAVALTIAGSDPSGGAGIQQDLKTMTDIKVYGSTVITAITSQNTLGVKDVLPIPAAVVKSQLDAVLSDLNVTAIKIGMVPNAEIAHTIASTLKDYKQQHPCDIIYDPVMVSTSGRRLMEESCIENIKQELFPLCTLVTPNIPETESLLGHPLHDEEGGVTLAQKYHTAFLIKGGHRKARQPANEEKDNDERATVIDYLCFANGSIQAYESPMIETHNLHGTGCTLSSAIASYIVQGYDLKEAVQYAKKKVTAGILKGKYTHVGKGNGPLILLDL